MKAIQRCQTCGSYGLSSTCPCGGERNGVRPPKYSPDDPHKDYRQRARLKQLTT